MQRGCDAGDPASCRWLGYASKASEDLSLARRAFDKACSLGDETACVETVALGVRTAGDWAACRHGLAPFCTEQKGMGCAGLANLLRLGRGGPVDLPGALVFAKRGCESRFGLACVEVAGLLGTTKAPGWQEGGKTIE